jgi:transcription elongation factor GreA
LSLAQLARQGSIDELERAWQTALAQPGEPASYANAIEVLCERDLASKALQLASATIDAYVREQRIPEALHVGQQVVRLGIHNDGLAKRLFELFEAHYGPTDWYPVIKDKAGLRPENLTTEAFEAFDRLRRYTAGHVIYHRSGWGEGVVEEFRAGSAEVVIRFASGRRTDLPLTTAIDTLTPLPDDDLRAMRLKDPAALQKLVETAPEQLIRKAARIYRGRISSAEVKGLLSPAIVPAKHWNAFWKRARAAAAIDPYLQVEGNPTRPTFVLRKKPLSVEEEVRSALRHCDDFGGEMAKIREFLERSTDEAATNQILDIATERLQSALQPGSKSSHAHVLEGLLLLEDRKRPVPKPAAAELRAMLFDAHGQFLPEAFDRLATQDAREHAVQLLPEALGEQWADVAVDALTRFPASVIERVVDLLQHHRQAARVLQTWGDVAPYPRRHPILTYLIGKLHNDGAFKDAPDAPDDVTIARVLLHLVRTLTVDKRDPTRMRLRARIVSLLANKRSFFARLLEHIDRDSLATFLGISERSGEDFPQEITDLILKAVGKLYPDLTAKPERPFWELDHVYVTASGLARQREEYRKLVEEKIPANSRAIGAAASYGDLSENSEWEAAMEEQRNLTARAMNMDQELRKARLIEDQLLPDDMVAPGTRLTWVTADGQRRSARLLGPWDAVEDDVINYRAPIARTLLGRSVGDEVEVPTPHGTERGRIESIEKLFAQ